MKLIIVGHGMVGHKFLECLAEAGAQNLEVTVLCEEPRPAYDRVHLSEFFAGKSAEDLSLVPEGFFEQHDNMLLRLNARAVEIDRAARTVKVSTGETLSYDKLILATGSYPFVPPVPGKDRKDCFVYRTIEDLEAMQECGARSKTGVVVGGGLLGLECAKALRDMGLQTHVVEFAPRLMAVQVDEGGGRMLRQKIAGLGVTAHTGKNTVEIVDGEDGTHRMVFADGTHLDTDMIVFSAGIRPRDELARACGLEVGARGGIAVDNNCRTSDPDVYAIGECALWEGKIYGLVAPGYDMARVAARHLRGEAAEFGGADMSTKLKLMGVDVASIGDPHGTVPGARIYQFSDDRKEVYKKLVVSDCGKYLLGGVLIGDASEYGTLLQMMLNRIELPESPEFLILPDSSGKAKPALGADALPDTAQICSCNNVSKGEICGAVCDGATSIGALKSCTKAGTACGGCVPLVTQIMKAEMKKQGMAVNNHLCEHFPFSRQELYHLVRVGKFKTFDALLEAHGSGMGCDICKPTVGSILASCWNEFVLKEEHASLQDSNDYYLANIQKDGTYSVVPRMPGGEVTPEGLIAVGQVAKKYGLYTKITGGQRVDLFGARAEELPYIWEELIAAGFESGHAYGKALRTVKSCVGSTWCRYGVGDSVGLAIELENRYKGLRAPHKIKFGVSGCTRECAEAQGKDVGVIATDKGWNLYVCGNGGMKPRHAELLASDLDHDTLVRYIDRFLMFYVRTADRLQRTSVWRDNLEGGLDYLKAVVLDDKLGIAAELEAEMQHVVDTYEDEWKKAVTDPETRKRFRHFVNSDRRDDNLVFIEERGQIRPATPEERKLQRSRMSHIPVVAVPAKAA
ncbi:nitrite reductase large subunit NirB [Cupriavidus taiwanensis]|uniref:NADH-dependent nitrite reductase n=1 Tax=Cupriavidus taiwanensis TaxID=164546 RepID=A0A7Z7JCU4_9BURK|nr:nitrite reductase large subunit NirB [Cupriavidus taiwanensis]SOZ09956.1 NADH-dependent nitrite reductase [Cupriavidus taiwanensis]SOZ12125.1 NADH-dependent nitrite reductase [Cupriavidus taiwanensis]SOZ43430.1 NADH-dependent nitrite reductase [Cupriavidus taiwanensis]SPC22672.1 NADH-dependent nitrite reductase [Cupriavidus taiwanensis]SPD54183.1 nitrite reductase, large subunit, nucleotide-and Fe/S-cluster binding [Cupriavidus taiwanensis]